MLSSVAFSSSSHLQSPATHDQSSPTSTVFEGLDDELHDARRVLSQGQEEDLRYALDRVLNKVEELSSLLKTAIKTQTELETQLNLARSNLQLVISNNEMLEEALKRETPYSARDVGWRRWSAREVQNHKTDEERPQSLDYGPLNEGGTPTVPSTVASILVNGVRPSSPPTSSVQPTTPMTTQESRFFRFRFSSGTRSPALSPHPSHLTSPSLSSLVPNAREKEFEELQEQLEQERRAHKAAGAAKAALEAELESLSQALFEEANKMVATERMKRAETEEELAQTRLEKDALHQALKLIEGENGRLRSAKAPLDMPSDQTDQPETSPPRCSSPDLPSPRASTGPPAGEVTPLTAPSYEIPRHLANFVLRPAPKPSLAGLHRKSLSIEGSGTASSPGKSLPSIAASPSVPLMPDEPSPWADVTS
ncbi:hypothetical protein L210DRAFT_855589 [Boletus edulis BED1]|uniref:GDP/GTP exchange factor Sec2 N-terminal domain-containing protein n=1 Tax=Boletus edulis BED1 TaxID=1328754 RepID=A0AAD4GHB0_BOLED|nr:hypothetical protein L210DRAFT_855589 [Boletus edulis BED1]